MAFEEKFEIKTVDENDNTWRLSLTPMKGRNNRYQLSFFLNGKEFLLTKLQSHRAANDMWELITKITNSSKDQRVSSDLITHHFNTRK